MQMRETVWQHVPELIAAPRGGQSTTMSRNNRVPRSIAETGGCSRMISITVIYTYYLRQLELVTGPY